MRNLQNGFRDIERNLRREKRVPNAAFAPIREPNVLAIEINVGAVKVIMVQGFRQPEVGKATAQCGKRRLEFVQAGNFRFPEVLDEFIKRRRIAEHLVQAIRQNGQLPMHDANTFQQGCVRNFRLLKLRHLFQWRVPQSHFAGLLETNAEGRAGVVHQQPAGMGFAEHQARQPIRITLCQRFSQNGFMRENRRNNLQIQGFMKSGNRPHAAIPRAAQRNNFAGQA